MSCTKDEIPQHGLYCISGACICFVLYTGAFYMFRTVPHRWVRRQTFIEIHALCIYLYSGNLIIYLLLSKHPALIYRVVPADQDRDTLHGVHVIE